MQDNIRYKINSYLQLLKYIDNADERANKVVIVSELLDMIPNNEKNTKKEEKTEMSKTNPYAGTQTEKNLESTLEALLAQNGVTPRSCEILLAESENSGIIISQISIYIDQSDSLRTSDITALVRQHFGLSPRVITE